MKQLNKSLHSVMFTVLFVVLLMVITFVFQILGHLFNQHDPYKMPRGHAVKVFQQGETNANTYTMFERLSAFYLYGEN